jgi:HEAT repeat protein
MIRDPAAVPALTEALKREDGWIRREFTRALRNIETADATKAAAQRAQNI